MLGWVSCACRSVSISCSSWSICAAVSLSSVDRAWICPTAFYWFIGMQTRLAQNTPKTEKKTHISTCVRTEAHQGPSVDVHAR